MTSGSYVLLIELPDPIRVKRGKDVHHLLPGSYVYCGSAHGPGGVEARVARHKRRKKKLHWHIDRVTSKAGVKAAGMSRTNSECELLAKVLTFAGASIPVPGFGSSDCRNCPSHLVRLPDSAVFFELGLEPV